MGKSLGQLGTPKVRPVDTFDWFDETGIAIGNASDLLLLAFLEEAKAIDEDNVADGLTLLQQFFHSVVAPEDFERFWAESIRQHQTSEDLMALMMTLVEGVTGFPTGRRSGSTPGRRSTGRKSKGGSRSPVVHRLERQGRGDLALAVRQHERALRSAG